MRRHVWSGYHHPGHHGEHRRAYVLHHLLVCLFAGMSVKSFQARMCVYVHVFIFVNVTANSLRKHLLFVMLKENMTFTFPVFKLSRVTGNHEKPCQGFFCFTCS